MKIIQHNTRGPVSWRCGRCGLHADDWGSIPCQLLMDDFVKLLTEIVLADDAELPRMKRKSADYLLHYHQTNQIRKQRHAIKRRKEKNGI